jgi:flagellar basal body P-ring formation protein FlgA
MFRASIALLLLVFALDQAFAQSAAMVPVRRSTQPSNTMSQLFGSRVEDDVIQTVATVATTPPSVDRKSISVELVDSTTRWAFQLRDDAVLSTPIVRLGDIVEPLDSNLAAWPRLQRVSVGLLPTDGTPMIVERDRLTHTITSIEATPRQINWYGKPEITVRYDATLANAPSPVVQASANSENLVTSTQLSHQQAINDSQVIAQTSFDHRSTKQAVSEQVIPEQASEPIVLDPIVRERIRHWIELAIRRELRELGEEYEVTVEDSDAIIAPLAMAGSLARIELAEPPREGQVGLTVIGRHRDGPIVVTVPIHLKLHPRVVVANLSLQRGERIGISDVRLAPLPEKQWRDSYATSIESIIGQEVRGIVREGSPISLKEVGAPILVHRGDLLEVRVIGGGVTITTNAKSIGEGAFAELVEVETILPRRRFIAKVVSPGLVEIVTRAPMVEQ